MIKHRAAAHHPVSMPTPSVMTMPLLVPIEPGVPIRKSLFLMTLDAAQEQAASEHSPETMNMPAAPPAALLLLPLVAARLTASEEVTPLIKPTKAKIVAITINARWPTRPYLASCVIVCVYLLHCVLKPF